MPAREHGRATVDGRGDACRYDAGLCARGDFSEVEVLPIENCFFPFIPARLVGQLRSAAECFHCGTLPPG